MELTGKIVHILPEISGESARGPWRKQEYIIETKGEYPKKVCFIAWSDKIDEFAIKQDEDLLVSIDLESREYNGRWYTDVKAWRVSRASSIADNFSSHARKSNTEMQLEEPSVLDDEIPF